MLFCVDFYFVCDVHDLFVCEGATAAPAAAAENVAVQQGESLIYFIASFIYRNFNTFCLKKNTCQLC